MEKSLSPAPDCSSRELQCVGKLEIARPKPVSGFLCGSIPVPTDQAFHAFNSALVPSSQTVSAPRYRMLPTETDLNMPPLFSTLPDKVLPISAVLSKPAGDLPRDGAAVWSNLSRKCEALAVSGLVEYGDEIDVIGPADILKQIFKMPYSKARLSIVVYRVGQTLVLNAGPDVEEGEKLIRRHSCQAKYADQSLLSNFAMHSVRVEACDCPPTHHSSSQKQSQSSVLPGGNTSQVVGQTDGRPQDGQLGSSEFSQVKQDSILWGNEKGKRSKRCTSVKKTSEVGEKQRCSVQESEKHKRATDNDFLRVLYWQFHNFRMLIGSDLLLFSNEKYVAVSLHLWDITRQVTPLNWLEAWLDNVMASVPELAICYHQNGVVQGYELLKTDDIFLLKGVSEDGTPAFHPYVVQQNGLSVFRFLQENCKQDPGAYWIHKGAGEDVIQLFDLCVIPKNHSSTDCDDESNSIRSLLYRERTDSLFLLGSLLYRIGHRLSLSMAPTNRAKCASFFRKCLDFLDGPDHLIIRAFAHEQFARLILNFDEELGPTLDSLPAGCEVTVTDAEEESLDFLRGISESGPYEEASSPYMWEKPEENGDGCLASSLEASFSITLEANASPPEKMITSGDLELRDAGGSVEASNADVSLAVGEILQVSSNVVQAPSDPISSKLAAIHHVSQAIKSLRWMRQLQSTGPDLRDQVGRKHGRLPTSSNISVCACGDVDCIEVCDLREWLPKSKLDHRLWKLVLLLGESYLALGQAYKEDGQLDQSLKVVELACSVYGSMPQHLEDTGVISSVATQSPLHTKLNDRTEKTRSYHVRPKEMNSRSDEDILALERYSSTYLFWGKAWTLVGDVFVEYHMLDGKKISVKEVGKSSTRELRMSSEVVKEVNRLRRKLGQFKQSCSSCSLVNCSCQSDRASSGSSASSSSGVLTPYSRKHNKKSYFKSSSYPVSGNHEDPRVCHKMENGESSNNGLPQQSGDDKIFTEAGNVGESGSRSPLSTPENLPGCSESFEMDSNVVPPSNMSSTGTPKVKNGGIFKYLRGPIVGGEDYNLETALCCYEEARKVLIALPSGASELESALRKKGWVCNELGRLSLERKELGKAEVAFADAIDAFREVSDHTNIILINCNLGHGRRALAEEMALNIEDLKMNPLLQNAYFQVLGNAKLEYRESLRFYSAAKSELDAVAEDTSTVYCSLRNEVYTQLAHTYLRFGMLLAKQNITAEVHENGNLENSYTVCTRPTDRRARKELKRHEISANEAIREALTIYESLGDSRKQEAAYAYFQLACYQKDRCLKFLESGQKKGNISKGETGILHRVKQYASLAERNWRKSMEFYGPKTHPTMFLTILMERSALSLSLADSLRSNSLLEAAVSHMLEGRHICETDLDSFNSQYPEMPAKFWSHLQMLLKKMVAATTPAGGSKSSSLAASLPARPGESGKYRELYKMSLKSSDFGELHNMHSLWIST